MTRAVPIVGALVALLMTLAPVAAEAAPALPLSNGRALVHVDATSGAPSGFRNHLYGEPSEGALTVDLLSSQQIGVAIDGETGVWLGDAAAESVDYRHGGMVVSTFSVDFLTVEVTTFAPWGLDAPAIAQVARVTNTSKAVPLDVNLAALADFDLGVGAPDAGGMDERIVLTGAGTFAEEGRETAHRMVHRVFPVPNQISVSPDEPKADFADFGTLPGSGAGGDVIEPFDGDDLRVAMGIGPTLLQPGESGWIGIVSAYGADTATLESAVDGWLAGRSPSAVLDDETAAWTAWLDAASYPDGVDASTRAALRHALALLRMAQVRETGAAAGQILASLDPGPRNKTWTRDSAYAVAALARAGHLDEAWGGLEFLLEGAAGARAELGHPYGVSVAAYFGDGSEDSADPLTVGLDSFGFALWAMSEWVAAGGEVARLAEHWEAIEAGIVDAIGSQATSDEDVILRADSGFWEKVGGERRNAISSLAAVAGYCAAARIADARGEAADALAWSEAAVAMRDAVLATFVSGDSLGASEVGGLDASLSEAVSWGVVGPDLALGALDELSLDGREGLARLGGEGADRQDRDEWVMATLRYAAALRAAGDPRADTLVAHVVAQAGARDGLLPERYSLAGAAAGSDAMIGFGAAALWLAFADVTLMEAGECRLGAAGPVEPGPEPPPEAAIPDEGGGEPDTGGAGGSGGSKTPVTLIEPEEGCASGGGSAMGWPLYVIVLWSLWAIRRRL